MGAVRGKAARSKRGGAAAISVSPLAFTPERGKAASDKPVGAGDGAGRAVRAGLRAREPRAKQPVADRDRQTGTSAVAVSP